MKKLSKRGFTLAEMLIAVLLLALVSLMTTIMTSVILTTTADMQEIAQAEILGNEALENLQRVIRFAQNIEFVNVDGEEETYFKYDVDESNKNYTVMISNGNAIGEGATIPKGMIMLTQLTPVKGEGSSEMKYIFETDRHNDNKLIGTPLFGGASYGENLTIGNLSFMRYGNKVTVSVEVNYGDKTLWSGSVSVRPINDMTVSDSSVITVISDQLKDLLTYLKGIDTKSSDVVGNLKDCIDPLTTEINNLVKQAESSATDLSGIKSKIKDWLAGNGVFTQLEKLCASHLNKKGMSNLYGKLGDYRKQLSSLIQEDDA